MSPALEMDLIRPSTNADAWGRYYTSHEISRVLVNAMTCVRPKLVLELGAGECALASAAHQKWKKAAFVTVDMDLAVTSSGWPRSTKTSHVHHALDALDDELADRIGVPLGSVDVGLCNPPYVRPRWRASFGKILEEAGLSGALRSVHDAGADLLFIAQNLRLLRDGGKLGLVIPDGLITGQKYRGVREVLLREHRVESVVQLPRSAFAKTEAQTYLLVLSKQEGETQSVLLSQMNDAKEVSSSISISADLAKSRLDYSFHASLARPHRGGASRKCRKLGDLAQGLLRGATSSSQIKSCPFPVFHLRDFPAVELAGDVPMVPSKFIHSPNEFDSCRRKYRVAEAGDILIARIGRNLQKKVCLLGSGSCVISDCIFAIRVAPELREKLINYLLSDEGGVALGAASHGVGAKHLSRSDVLDLVLPF
ncbi:TPA: N-6 DNA methylase [Stenotrophomonas maltophilia]|nr:N-6 DNA methylase [Stenotrophomonas maltophilia]